MENYISKHKAFPKEIDVIKITETTRGISLKLKSKTRSQLCPLCKRKSSSYHSTYKRKIQDLPFAGKPAILEITAYKYDCDNVNCNQKVFCEELDGFTGKYRRMTSRCEDLIIAIALNTNCEFASLVCSHIGIKINGDTVIRLLLNKSKARYGCREVIEVDNNVLKNCSKYPINIYNTHTEPIYALLGSHDNEEIKKWLKTNRRKKKITNHNAEYYANTILERISNLIQTTEGAYSFFDVFSIVRSIIHKTESIVLQNNNRNY